MENKYLVLKGCAGLGNRLLTIKDAILYAKANKRTLYIDWSDGWHLNKNQNSFYIYFDLIGVDYIKSIAPIINAYNNGATTYPKSLTTDDLNQDIYSNFYFKIRKPNKYISHYFSYLENTNWAYLVRNRFWYRINKNNNNPFKRLYTSINSTNKFLFGSLLHTTKREENIVLYTDFGTFENSDEIFKYIKLKDEYIDRFTNFAVSQYLNNRIGIHIRYTDKRPTTSLEHLFNMIDTIYLPKSQGIFLSTDNPEIEELFRQRYKELVITYHKEMPPIGCNNVGKADFGGIHHWAINQDLETKKQLFEATIADMWLLSMCKYLLWQGNSSFSYISTILKKDKTNIIDWTRINND